jgi:hypothetical protein
MLQNKTMILITHKESRIPRNVIPHFTLFELGCAPIKPNKVFIWANIFRGQLCPMQFNRVGQRTYHAHCHWKCNNDAQLEAYFGWMWDWPSIQDSINNKCE